MDIMANDDNIPVIAQTGFRIFFLAAISYAIVAIGGWAWQLYSHQQIAITTISRAHWHAHEMLFGYTTAVIAGFLLTAVQNWTGQKTARGRPLLLLFSFWLIARLLSFVPSASTLPIILFASNVFYAGLLFAILRPIIDTRNNAQWGIASKLVLLWLLDCITLCIAAGWLDNTYTSKIFLVAVYTVIGLILVMAQRVMPSFTRNAISSKQNVRDYLYIPQISLVLLLIFMLADVMDWKTVLLISGIATVIVNAVRLYGWHDKEIWQKPLLWVLFIALCFIVTGIGLRATAHLTSTLPDLGLHAMTYGGIGVITLGMMARVSLGHTGRNVFKPPPGLSVMFLMIIIGAVIRSLLPLILLDYYFLLILISQIFWIGAFMLMLVFFLEPLLSARPDGQYG